MAEQTIIYLGGFELPDKNAAAHRVLSNGKIFKRLGYNVVYIGINKTLDHKSSILNTKQKIQNFDCFFIPYPGSLLQWISHLCTIKPLETVIKEYPNVKVVVCYNYQSPAFLKTKYFCKKRNIKLVADCTEWHSVTNTHFPHKIVKGIDTCIRMRFIHKQLDGLIVISNWLQKYYQSCRNVIRIPPLVDLVEEKWHISKISQSPPNQMTFVYSGDPGKKKDRIDIIVEILDGLNSSNKYLLYFIGLTKEQYLQQHPQHNDILRRNVDKILFLGQLNHKKSLKYLSKADFTILVRDDNRLTKAGFPTKFVESLSCGVPVITNKTSDLESYLIEGKTGYWIPTNDQEATKTIFHTLLLMDKNDIARMKKACAEMSLFHYEKYLDSMQTFTDKLLYER